MPKPQHQLLRFHWTKTMLVFSCVARLPRPSPAAISVIPLDKMNAAPYTGKYSDTTARLAHPTHVTSYIDDGDGPVL